MCHQHWRKRHPFGYRRSYRSFIVGISRSHSAASDGERICTVLGSTPNSILGNSWSVVARIAFSRWTLQWKLECRRFQSPTPSSPGYARYNFLPRFGQRSIAISILQPEGILTIVGFVGRPGVGLAFFGEIIRLTICSIACSLVRVPITVIRERNIDREYNRIDHKNNHQRKPHRHPAHWSKARHEKNSVYQYRQQPR